MLALLLMAQSVPATQAGVNSPIAVPVQGVDNGKSVKVDASGSTITVSQPLAVGGSVADNTASTGNPVPLGAYYAGSTPPTYSTTGVRTSLTTDTRGNLAVLAKFSTATGSDTISNTNLLSGVQFSQGNASATANPLLVASTIYSGSQWGSLRSLQATDSGTGLGVLATGIVPTSAASQAIPYTTVFGGATSVLKASAGNLYGINANNSTTAAFVVAYNGTSAPTSGTALTAANMAYCFALPASQSSDKVFSPPVRMGTGITLLVSTSCTTYTTPGVLPLTLTGYFQ